MISWKSLHVEVYRDTHDQAGTSGDGDQHELLRGSWMISRVVRRRMRRHDRLPDSGWAVLAARPVAQVRQVSAHRPRAAEGSGEHHDQRRVSGEPSCLGC